MIIIIIKINNNYNKKGGLTVMSISSKTGLNLGIREFFFSQRIVDNWNQLPEETESASSTSTFKKKLDNWME